MDGLITTNTSYAGLVGLVSVLSPVPPAMYVDVMVPTYEWSDIAHYRKTNVTTEILVGHQRLVGDQIVDQYQPRTDLGRKLIELRQAYILGGGKLLSWEELDEEIRQRRGGVPDE